MTCKRCDYLASEVMRIREDRNEWRAVAVWFAAHFPASFETPYSAPGTDSATTEPHLRQRNAHKFGAVVSG